MAAIGAVLAAAGVAFAFGLVIAGLAVLAALVDWSLWRSSTVFVGPAGAGTAGAFGRRTPVPVSEITRIDVVDIGYPGGSSDGLFVFVDGDGDELFRVPATEPGNSGRLEPVFERLGVRPTVPEDHSLTPDEYADTYGASVAGARRIRNLTTGLLGLVVLAAMFATAAGIILEVTNLRYSLAAPCQSTAISADCRLTAKANVLTVTSAGAGSSQVSFFAGRTPVPDATISSADVASLKLQPGTPATVELWGSQITVITANNQTIETSATESTAWSLIAGGAILLAVGAVVLRSDVRGRRRRFAPMFPPGPKPAPRASES